MLPIVLSFLLYVRSVSLADFLEFVSKVRFRQKWLTCKVLCFALVLLSLVHMNEYVVQFFDGCSVKKEILN